MTSRYYRSLLFTPATSPRKCAKAFECGADGVVIDLEDSVAVTEKTAARQAVADLLSMPRRGPTFIRINAMSTAFCLADLQAVMRSPPDGVMLPKVESAAELQTIDWLLGQFEVENQLPVNGVELMPIVETARGLVAAVEIARASPRVRQIAFGAVDLARDMGLVIDDETGPLAHARFTLGVASRAAGLRAPFDSAFAAHADLAGLRTSAERARAFGFEGKGCIHPAQVAVVNDVFSPNEAERAQARRIVALFEDAERKGQAAVSLDGVMIDYPVAERARAVLAIPH